MLGLYLVVWNICDGEKGLNEIVQWLVNIQVIAGTLKCFRSVQLTIEIILYVFVF